MSRVSILCRQYGWTSVGPYYRLRSWFAAEPAIWREHRFEHARLLRKKANVSAHCVRWSIELIVHGIPLLSCHCTLQFRGEPFDTKPIQPLAHLLRDDILRLHHHPMTFILYREVLQSWNELVGFGYYTVYASWIFGTPHE